MFKPEVKNINVVSEFSYFFLFPNELSRDSMHVIHSEQLTLGYYLFKTFVKIVHYFASIEKFIGTAFFIFLRV